MHLNTWTGIGNVVADPQLQTTPSGKRWTKFTIVCKEFYYDDGGKLKQSPTFIDIVAWNEKADAICKNVKKGFQLLVQGRLKIKFYKDPKHNGLRRKSVQIEGSHFSWEVNKKSELTQEDAIMHGLQFVMEGEGQNE